MATRNKWHEVEEQSRENAVKALRETGFDVQFCWEIDGPEDTGIRFVLAYKVAHTVCHVAIYEHGGFEILMPADPFGLQISDTVAAIKAHLTPPEDANR